MAAAGTAADDALKTANAQPHILVVNGSIPLGENGAYTTIAGRSAESILRESAENATAIFAVGACAHWGSVQASRPNPTGAVGVDVHHHGQARHQRGRLPADRRGHHRQPGRTP